MADTMFRDYLVVRAEKAKNDLSNADLTTEEILAKATEILKIENRVKRMDNPIPRKPRTPKDVALI